MKGLSGALWIPIILLLSMAKFVSSVGQDIPSSEYEPSRRSRFLQQYYEPLFRKTGRARTRGRGQTPTSGRSSGGGSKNPFLVPDFYHDFAYDGSDPLLLQSDAAIVPPLPQQPYGYSFGDAKYAKKLSKSAKYTKDVVHITATTIDSQIIKHDNYHYPDKYHHKQGSKSKSKITGGAVVDGKGKGGEVKGEQPKGEYPRPPKGSKTCKSRKSKSKGYVKDQTYYYDGKQTKQHKGQYVDDHRYGTARYGYATRYPRPPGDGTKTDTQYVYQAGQLRPIEVDYKDASWSALDSSSSEDDDIASDVAMYYYAGEGPDGGKGKGKESRKAKSDKGKDKGKGSKSQKYRQHMPYDYQHDNEYYDDECVEAAPSITRTTSPTTTPFPSYTPLPSFTPMPSNSPEPSSPPSDSGGQEPTVPPGVPTGTPTASPTVSPTGTPTGSPTGTPTGTPTVTPTGTPTGSPTGTPTGAPTATPTGAPTATLTGSPTITPTGTPTAMTNAPTMAPTAMTVEPTAMTMPPTPAETNMTSIPTIAPSTMTTSPPTMGQTNNTMEMEMPTMTTSPPTMGQTNNTMEMPTMTTSPPTMGQTNNTMEMPTIMPSSNTLAPTGALQVVVPFGLMYTIDPFVAPSASDLETVTQLTQRFLEEILLLNYDFDPDTNLDTFMLMLITSMDENGVTTIDYEATANFGSISTMVPTMEEVEAQIQTAFTDLNLEVYLDLLQNTGPDNAFSMTNAVTYNPGPAKRVQSLETPLERYNLSGRQVIAVIGAGFIVLIGAAVMYYEHTKSRRASRLRKVSLTI